jgi:hypothetical protein
MAEKMSDRTEHVAAKLAEMGARRGFTISLAAALDKSKDYRDLEPRKAAALAWKFGIQRDCLRLFMLPVTATCSVVFICDGLSPVEVVSFRGLRTLAAMWEKVYLSHKPAGIMESERYKRTFKFKYVRKIQGGLIRQERCPRIRGKGRLPMIKALYFDGNGVLADSLIVKTREK